MNIPIIKFNNQEYIFFSDWLSEYQNRKGRKLSRQERYYIRKSNRLKIIEYKNDIQKEYFVKKDEKLEDNRYKK